MVVRGAFKGRPPVGSSLPHALANLATRGRPLALQGGVGTAVGGGYDSDSHHSAQSASACSIPRSKRAGPLRDSQPSRQGTTRLNAAQRRQRTQANIAARSAHNAAIASGSKAGVRRTRRATGGPTQAGGRERRGSFSSVDDSVSVGSSVERAVSRITGTRDAGTAQHMTPQQVQYTAMMAAAVAAAAAARQQADEGFKHPGREGVSVSVGGESATAEPGTQPSGRRATPASGGSSGRSEGSWTTSPSQLEAKGNQSAMSRSPGSISQNAEQMGADPVPGMRKLLSTAQLASGTSAMQPQAFHALLRAFQAEHAALLHAGQQVGAQPGHVAWAQRQAQNARFGVCPTLPPQAFAAGLRGLVPNLEAVDAWGLVRGMHLEQEADIDFSEFTEALQTLAGSSQQAVYDTLAVVQRSELSTLDEELARELDAQQAALQ